MTVVIFNMFQSSIGKFVDTQRENAYGFRHLGSSPIKSTIYMKYLKRS